MCSFFYHSLKLVLHVNLFFQSQLLIVKKLLLLYCSGKTGMKFKTKSGTWLVFLKRPFVLTVQIYTLYNDLTLDIAQ